MSPQFRNNRMIEKEHLFIPPLQQEPVVAAAASSPETVVFDKAEEAASLESLRSTFSDLEKRKEELRKIMKDHQDAELAKDEKDLERVEQQLDRLAKVIADREDKAAERD